MDFFDVSEKVVVITGASGALGGEYAQILLKANAKVVCLDISVSENISYYKKVIKPTQREIESHQHYIKTSLKKNFY